MKLTQTILCAVIAGTMAFAAGKASAIPVQLPLVKLNIAGIMAVGASAPDDNGKVSKAKSTALKINAKSLIGLLNDSTNVQTTLSDLGLPAQIPDDCYFVWNPGSGGLTLTNSSGFSFTLTGQDAVLANSYNYGSITIHAMETIGINFSQNDTTGAGNETDLTGMLFAFNDGVGDSFASYGNGTLKWKFGKVDGGSQETTLKANLTPSNGYVGLIGGMSAMTLDNFKVSGSGKGEISEDVFPFYL